MGKLFKSYLSGGVIYVCSTCRSHLALHDELISKAFQGRHGRAYLFGCVVNVSVGPKEDRMLTTGLHTVCDIFCTSCQENIGWFYEEAFEPSQKYKEGKYIIEKAKMTKENIDVGQSGAKHHGVRLSSSSSSLVAAAASSASSSSAAAAAHDDDDA
eukprot:TRINITY_DN65905_c2_g1_i1.p1 TRINITY_DN65905_c2_g1~~TRINITY_DN65905_c2_g1_i1.p1  ORF type:complete len:163 (+),score=60.78 TRINITY_DN65905_c2_g1_i1:22-489(+)